jgi:hypothetical protein
MRTKNDAVISNAVRDLSLSEPLLEAEARRLGGDIASVVIAAQRRGSRGMKKLLARGLGLGHRNR